MCTVIFGITINNFYDILLKFNEKLIQQKYKTLMKNYFYCCIK